MPLKELLIRMIKDVFLITTGVVLCMSVYCMIYYPNDLIRISQLWQLLLPGILFSFPSIVFWAKKELSKSQWLIRSVYHFVLLEVVVVFSGRFVFGWLRDAGISNYLVLMGEVLVVYLLVRFIGWKSDQGVALQINERLKELS